MTKMELTMNAKFHIILIFFGLMLFSNISNAGARADTHYPIVLVGGSFINFDKLGPIEFFYKIPGALIRDGASAFVSTVSAVNTPEVRGEQLAEQIRDIVAITGKEKVNLISISSGGLTARYTASAYPEIVASVTTINAGHAGTPIADIAVNTIEHLPQFIQNLIWIIGDKVTRLIAWIAGDDFPMDAKALALSHTTESSALFSERYPEGKPTEYCGQAENELAENGVRYFAFAGSHHFTNWRDPADYILALTHKFMNESSDGAFGHCSSHWGVTIRDDLYLNHLDEANHLFGLSSARLNPLELFVGHANRLKGRGL